MGSFSEITLVEPESRGMIRKANSGLAKLTRRRTLSDVRKTRTPGLVGCHSACNNLTKSWCTLKKSLVMGVAL